MNDRLTHKWLDEWNVREFLEEQRRLGRAMLSEANIARYASDHEKAADLLEKAHLNGEDAARARILRAITEPIAALHLNSIPTYYSYTGVNVLDEYVDERLDLDAQKILCVTGLRGLLLELTRFESQSIVGIEPWSTGRLDRDIACRRLQLLLSEFNSLKELSVAVNASVNSHLPTPRFHKTLRGYCEDRLSAVIHFTCLPRTQFHDEVLFLRTIAEDELCFKGIYIAIRQAVEAIERNMPEAAPYLISQANAFAVMLHQSFRVLQSMPPSHFADFRDATGNASAVQSYGYQRLDIALFGLNPEKIPIYQRIRHLQSLVQFAGRDYASFGSVLARTHPTNAVWDEIVELSRRLDRHLLSWRGLHLSFALCYLPPEANGTGGTAGPSYLRKYLKHTLFPDTEPDYELIKEVFGEVREIQELFSRIAPPRRLWGS
jgi:tryptophan 2,3-dioxygenase